MPMAGSFEPKADTEIIGRAGGMQVRAARSQPSLEIAPVPEPPPPPVPPERGRRKLGRLLAESAVVAAMTLGCLAIFIVLLNLSFPEGHDLRELLRSNRDASAGLEALRVGRGGDSTATIGNSMATLSVLHASVHSRTAGSIAWNSAQSGLGLRAGDGIQTGAAGTAELNLEHGSIRLEKNSLVILGGGTDVSDLLARTPRSLTVVRGDLFARLDGGSPGEMTVMLPQGIARLHPVAPASVGSAEFRITAGPDRSSAVTVLSGSLALEANGRTVSVGPGQFSRIGGNGAPSEPLPVPEAPVALTPGAGSRFAYLDLPPVVPFRWNASGGDGHYRLRATRGPEFKSEIMNQTTADSALDWGRFDPGVYEWQVSRVINGVEGVPSAPRRLVVEQVGGPVLLTVEPLPRRVSGPGLTVRGRARPGASVFVMGQRVRVRSDGTFDAQVDLPTGANVVLVEAVDAAGNSMYSSQVVYAAN
jgi:hypothetical protein